MVYLALGLFICAFIGGLFMALKFSQEEEIPLAISLAHGGAAAAGLVVLFMLVSDGGGMASNIALAAYILAASGGISMFIMGRVLKKSVPGLMITGHALIAIAGCSAISWATYTALTAT
ncbi:MAG: hypothetical protein JKY01_01140 [Pseudomonadales bacterium]|nr:hypothetical protein [Pseudomonadales bacterium]